MTHPMHPHVHHHHASHGPHLSATQVFISQHLADARIVSLRSGVPISVILAQSGLESGWGRHVVGHAYFGVKGHAPNGASVNFTTHENLASGSRVELNDRFRAYTSYLDAATDNATMLRRRFPGAFSTRAGIPFAAHLARYATDPHYIRKLQHLIRTQHLDQYDVL